MNRQRLDRGRVSTSVLRVRLKKLRTAAILAMLALLAVALGRRLPIQPSPIRVLSYNIRYDNPQDGPNAWPNRKWAVAKVIRHEADIAGLQEVLLHQLQYLANDLPEFEWYGVGRDDGHQRGEYAPIFFRRDRFAAIDAGEFWLSETPDDAGSVGWDAAAPRIVTWLQLYDRSRGTLLYVFNTHWDHVGEQARIESAALLAAQIAELKASVPCILTGDFNCLHDSQPLQTLRSVDNSPVRSLIEAGQEAQRRDGPGSTWNGFQALVPGRQIDFVFVDRGTTVHSYRVLDPRANDGFASDHLPVAAEITPLP